MDIKQILACGDVLGEMCANFAAMPSQKEEAAKAALHFAMVHSYVVEYATHLANGLEPYEALEATAMGRLEIPPSKATVLQILAAKPKE